MDLLISIIFVILIGGIKVATSSNETTVTITNTENVTETVKVEDLPIVKNLALEQELDAYTKILKELGLKV